MKERIEARGIACEQVSDSTFHRPVGPCDICRTSQKTAPCRHSADCLQVEPLFGAIQEAGERLASTKLFREKGVGVILVQGIHTLPDDALNAEPLAKIWLFQDFETCLKPTLISRGLWRPDDIGNLVVLIDEEEERRHIMAKCMEIKSLLPLSTRTILFREFPDG